MPSAGLEAEREAEGEAEGEVWSQFQIPLLTELGERKRVVSPGVFYNVKNVVSEKVAIGDKRPASVGRGHGIRT